MWIVYQTKNPLAVHVHTWSEERCLYWIEKYGDSNMFVDKTLTKESFSYREIEDSTK